MPPNALDGYIKTRGGYASHLPINTRNDALRLFQATVKIRKYLGVFGLSFAVH